MRTIIEEPMVTAVGGIPAAVAVPVIPADASPALREGLRRRRVAAALGRCPCGAVRPAMTAVQHASAEQGTAWMPFPHADACAAHDDLLGPAIDAWSTAK